MSGFRIWISDHEGMFWTLLGGEQRNQFYCELWTCTDGWSRQNIENHPAFWAAWMQGLKLVNWTGGERTNCYFNAQSKHGWKRTFSLKLSFLGGWQEVLWGLWHEGVTEVRVTCHFLPTRFAVGIFRGQRDGFAFGGIFCRGAYGLPVGEKHILPASARWTFWPSSYEYSFWCPHCEIAETRWGEQWTKVARGDQKRKHVPIPYSKAGVCLSSEFLCCGLSAAVEDSPCPGGGTLSAQLCNGL